MKFILLLFVILLTSCDDGRERVLEPEIPPYIHHKL